MLRCDNVNRKIQIVLAGIITANQLPVMVMYSDRTSTAYSGAAQLANTNSTTAVDICAAPAASTIRDIDYISVRNSDTVAATATIRYNDNATLYTIVTVTLAVGDQLVYVHGDGWRVVDASGYSKVTNIALTGGVTTVGNVATVVTNANLTGHVTSVGNAAVLGSFTLAQLNTAVSDADVVSIGATETITGAKTFNAPVVLSAGSAALPALTTTGDTNTGMYFSAADTIDLAVGGAREVSVSSGLVGIGAAAGVPLANTNVFISRDTAAGTGFAVQKSFDGANTANMVWRKSRGTTAAPTPAVSGDGVANLIFQYCNTGTTFNNAASIVGTSSVSSATSSSGYLSFQTTPDGSTGLVERLRIAADGTVGIGAPPTLGMLHVAGALYATGIRLTYTNTATVGAVTINDASGRVNIAAAGTAVVVTNSLVTAASHVMAVASTADTTARVTSVVPAAGSFTINTVATTAQTSFDFVVFNAD